MSLPVAPPAPPTFPEFFAAATAEGGPAPELVGRVFDAILRGEWTAVQVAGMAVTLRLLGERAGTIAAAARSLRAAMTPVDHGLPRVLDTCGTGGDGAGTLNLSTGAALIAAARGIPVAKHGNRAVSSRAGSADVVEALGVPLDVPPAEQAALLREVGIAFLMAPAHHPALRHGGVARRELGIRTIFNGLGPLANPARATHQLLGAWDDALRPVLAATLHDLGVQRAWVVHGEDGLDEVSPSAATRITVLADGELSEQRLTPEDFGFQRLPRAVIAGGDAAHNAAVLERVLAGEPHPARDAFALNGAAALAVAEGLPPREAGELARGLLARGAARDVLEAWRVAARRRVPQP